MPLNKIPRLLLLLPALLLAVGAAAQQGPVGPVEPLWPGGAPGALGTTPADQPSLTVVRPPAELANGTAVVVVPGGGYGHLALDHEGRQVAEWLNSLGVTAFVLKYRLGPKYRHPAMLNDAQRAIRTVRARAAEWGVDPERIGILGFSAGGHLSSTAGTHFDAGRPDAADPVERVSSRPDFMVLVYPVITLADPYAHKGSRRNLLGESPDPALVELLSSDRQVTPRTPPTFLVHSTEDAGVPVENSLLMYQALRRAGVPVEMHIYERGRHGFGLGLRDPILSSWPGRAAAWMASHGFLPPPAPRRHSRLWGRDGELWTAGGRLPDFSFAGYHRGDDPIPTPPVTHNVRQFGAVGDGQADDSDAFLRAIAAVDSGVILIPKGRYRITKILEIRKPDVVLRGEHRDSTVLFFPQPLSDIRPDWGATTEGRRTSNYAWSGGFIWAEGSYGTEKIADVVAPARRGDRSLRLRSTAGLQVGQEVEIREHDTPSSDNSLAVHLYDEDGGDVTNIRGRTHASLVTRITGIQGDRVTFDRPLRFDVRAEWEPAVYRYAPTVREVGIENLTFHFPVTPYQGHFTELGFNPIALEEVADCWVRNVRFRNADNGPFVSSRFCTLDGLVYESERQPDPDRHSQGHHGVYILDDDNLFTRFDLRTEFQHDLSVSHAAGNVISAGRGADLSLDHHRRVPYANLFTDLDAGEGSHLWRSGGGAKLGKHAAGRSTFWNIRARRPLSHPGEGWGPWSMNLVGLHTTDPSQTDPRGRWFESIPPAQLYPQNLHHAQRALRQRSTPR